VTAPATKKAPAAEEREAPPKQNIVSLPATKKGSTKTGRNRYIRLFPERLLYVLEMLTDQEVKSWLRVTIAYAVADGELRTEHLASISKAGKRWPDLRDKLLALGLGRIEGDRWIDDDQERSLAIQRSSSERGRRGAAGRWGGRDA